MFLCVEKKNIVNVKKIGKVFEYIATEKEENSNDITILFKLESTQLQNPSV